MRPRHDGYYLSTLQRSEDWHAGVCIVDKYHRHLWLTETGAWLHADRPAPDPDFPTYLALLTDRTFPDGLAGRDPLDGNLDFLHQTGRYTVAGRRIRFVHFHELVVRQEARWELQIVSPDRLTADDGTVYQFQPWPECG